MEIGSLIALVLAASRLLCTHTITIAMQGRRLPYCAERDARAAEHEQALRPVGLLSPCLIYGHNASAFRPGQSNYH